MRQQEQRTRSFSRVGRAGVVALGVGVVLGMAGCSAGQVAQTAQEQPAVNGSLGQTGKIAIRDASLVYPDQTKGVYAKGSDIELAMTIVSRKQHDDKLVKVSSESARDVAVKGSRVIPGNDTVVVGKPAHAGKGGASPEDLSGKPETGHMRIVLRDTTLPVRSGQTLSVTFTFEEAGSISMEMPMATPDASVYNRSGSAEGEAAESTPAPESGGETHSSESRSPESE